ncbi:FAD-binding oxidoreductase [Rhizobium sp. L1K21]|uniref:NAD(P)/FAD-dependent oxidoreductase n=1 Tax=Rhizobium sp. L1K21 TaxID=2954933 RepID=UPI002093606A|nr:FAD-dependent oxidoreductase [Rhizobium sp. L1K21]MCO6185632.1 FAD-dependent oxidoreductase [Rhizobium sp. L1K21]
MVRHFRFIVIGRGLMGSAAGKYLAENTDGVALVGPDEPQGDWAKHDGVFASHYDEGRITRSIDPDPLWARLAGRSIARYRDIEARSGVSFYQEKGALLTGPAHGEGAYYIENAEAVASKLGLDVAVGGDDMLADRFPYFSLPEDTAAIFEPKAAGYISPRNLVKAQNVLAQKAGADIIPAVAVAVREQAGRAVVDLADGETLTADKVLVATGGFSIMKGLLPQPLDMTVYARTVVFFELGEAETERLAGMPSMINKALEEHENTYMLPPIRYPDGKTYLKIGGDPEDIPLADGKAVAEWFRTGPSGAVVDHLVGRMRALVRDLRAASIFAKPCVTSFSANGFPMIGWTASPHIAVMTAGAGASAKSSDEIGRLGAELIRDGRIVSSEYDVDLSPVFR